MTKLTTHVLDVFSGRPGKGIKVELVDFSEPNSLLGSFRCATLPLQRLH